MNIKHLARKHAKKGITFLLLVGVMVAMGIAAFATSRTDYTAPAVGAVSYDATARVDESIGLRAGVTLTDTSTSTSVTGITPTNTKITSGLDVSVEDDFQIDITPYKNYTLDNVVVSAIAEITHDDGTMEAVKDVQEFPASVAYGSTYTDTYTIPDFTGYVTENDEVEVEIVVYADFTYTPTPSSAVDCTIDLTSGTVTGSSTAGISVAGRLFTIDTTTAAGKTVRVIGETSYVSSSNTNYQIRVYNSTKSSSTRDIHLIFDDVKMYTVGADYTNYDTENSSTAPTQFSSNVSAAGTSNRQSTTTQTSYALLGLADVDAYVTFNGENILTQTYYVANGGTPNTSAIQVDASASLIVTDASTGGSLYARGGGCSAAIGSSGAFPSGYVEIDGGDITATSAHSTHAYAGIGNGGHYGGTGGGGTSDPGTRGIVVNDGNVELLGFHYGIGANGGLSSGGASAINSAIGPQYILITGGNVISETSAGSAGASIGFAFNNEQHEVRIGRPDKSDGDSSVMSVNWGYGAAISGKMTFYSGTTSAYSGQYAAAIGGNAVSYADTYTSSVTQALVADTAIEGTPLTVYGGNVTAEAGAFEQVPYGDLSWTGNVSAYCLIPQDIRGASAGRVEADDVLSETRPATSYGAAIGGAIAQKGGDENKIFAGTFDVYSSVYGAGIGGGGGYDATGLTYTLPSTSTPHPGTANAGGDGTGSSGGTWIGNLYDLSSGDIEDMDFTITADNNGYGAGFGGGGSSSENGGSGGNVYLGGGTFEIYGSLYGAGFGGGGSLTGNGGSGGDEVVINDGDFTVYSSVYGAGIGGGGSNSGAGGDGGSASGSFTINGGNFTVETGRSWERTETGSSPPVSADHAPSDVTVKDVLTGTPTYYYTNPSYGAGIGGGGSVSGAGGNGSAHFLATGGIFKSYSNGYGAGIGGGGSLTGVAGDGGTATYEGGTVEVDCRPQKSATDTSSYYDSVGMGGGSSSVVANRRTDQGTVYVIGGNIYTQIASMVGGDPTQHAWTLPWQDGFPPGFTTFTSSTSKAVSIETDPGEVSNHVKEVAFSYWDVSTPGVSSFYYEYGVNDMLITYNATKNVGEAWVWVPAEFKLTYDLNSPAYSGTVTGSTSPISDFDLADANRSAVGKTFLIVLETDGQYTYPGEQKTLVTWDESMDPTHVYDGATWDAMANSHAPALTYPSSAMRFTNYVEATDGTNDLALVGWTTDDTFDHIFAVSDGWDYTQHIEPTVQFNDNDITVYAVWGYDMNNNNIADIFENDLHLTYDGNPVGIGAPTVSSVPTNSMGYSQGDAAPVATTTPTHSNNYIFMGWTDGVAAEPLLTVGDSLPSPIYVGGSSTNNTISYGSGYSIVGDDNEVLIGTFGTTLYALWGEDTNGNGIPDVLETPRQLIHDGNGATAGVPGNKLYVDGNTGVTDAGAGLTPWSTVMTAPTGPSGNTAIFLGWSEDQTKAQGVFFGYGDAANLPTDITNPTTDPLTLSAPFNGQDKTVYAVWSDDANNNQIPDVFEDGYGFVFEDLSRLGDKVPVDSDVYYENELVSTISTVNDLLDAGTAGLSPYMERDGYVFLGWTLDNTLAGDYDTAAANTFALTAGVMPNDPTMTDVYLTYNPTNPTGHFMLSDLNGFIFDAATIAQYANANGEVILYAVWANDPKNAGIPEWDYEYGRTVHYYSSMAGATNMPYSVNGNIDDNSTTTYVKGETADVDSTTIPQKSGYVFMGWSPVYVGGTVFGYDYGELSREDFYTLLCLLEDIRAKDDLSTKNNTVNMGGGGGGVSTMFGGNTDPVNYGLNSGLESLYEGLGDGTYSSVRDAYNNYDWVSPFVNGTYNYEGFLSEVRFDAFNSTKDQMDGTEWELFGIWAADDNANGVPDIFEDTYTLYFDFNGGQNGPSNIRYNLPDYTRVVNSLQQPTRLDPVSNSNMHFLGWTADPSAQGQVYTYNDRSKVPSVVGAVTFGNFDITLYAVWSTDNDGDGIPDVYQDGFTLTYDANGGTGEPVDSTIYQYGESTPVSTTEPSHSSGYLFMYWTDDASVAGVYAAGDRANLPTLIDNVVFTTTNVTLYAVWGEDTNGNNIPDVFEDPYTLTYNANGGTGVGLPIDNNSYMWNQTVALQSGAGMTHSANYVFVGWTTADPTTFNTVYTTGESASLPSLLNYVTFTYIDVEVYAVWSTDNNGNGIPDVMENSYEVTYDANGGTGTQTDSYSPYLENDSVTVLDENDMANTGYTFKGWNTAADGSGTSYADGDTFVITANTTLYAQWESFTTTYTVTYDANGGTGSQTDSNTYSAGSTVTVLGKNDMANASYVFAGWNTVADGSGTSYMENSQFAITADTTLYAQWKTSYTVTYDANGGTGSQTDSNAYADGSTVTVLGENDMANSGYAFTGWNTAADGTGANYQENDTFTITADTTLYAQWKTAYTVTYDANGGTGSPTDQSSPYAAGSMVTVLGQGNMVNSGYVFTGWNTAAGGSGTSYAAGDTFVINSNTVLYAQWTLAPQTYTVTYDANGGTGSYSEVAGGSYAVLSNTDAGISPSSNYLFKNWNTAADGSGTSYAAGDVINLSGDVTFYAQWRSILTEDHIAYVSGYPDGSVMPENPISREEVAMIFFRLLDQGAHPDKETATVNNPFSDVKEGDWSTQAIKYMASIGILSGDGDGTYRPADLITRAEYAAVVSKFDALSATGTNAFTDVDDGHWAVAVINSAYAKGWISGYGDGTFKPDSCITREEAIALTNKVLNRCIDAETLKTIVNPYWDITTSKWSYAAIIEASFGHDYTRDSNGEEHWIAGSFIATLVEVGKELVEVEPETEVEPEAESSESETEVVAETETAAVTE